MFVYVCVVGSSEECKFGIWKHHAPELWLFIVMIVPRGPRLIVLRSPQTYKEETVPALKMNEENLPKGGWEQVWHISIKLMEPVDEVCM